MRRRDNTYMDDFVRLRLAGLDERKAAARAGYANNPSEHARAIADYALELRQRPDRSAEDVEDELEAVNAELEELRAQRRDLRREKQAVHALETYNEE